MSPPSEAPAREPSEALRACLAALGVYGGYAVLSAAGAPGELRGLALVAAFYFLPGWLLRKDPERAARYQVGPDSPIPRLTRRAVRVAAVTVACVFPVFCLGFFWFYARVCAGELGILSPVLLAEGLTPFAGGLEAFLGRLCATHGGGFWPEGFAVPPSFAAYWGLGAVYQVVLEVCVVALPEEVFHRGYLMNALEERFPPKVRIFGVHIGLAAVASSLIFAVGHLVSMAQVGRLATFFPALLFAYLFRLGGSLWAPALAHAASNILMAFLIAATFPS